MWLPNDAQRHSCFFTEKFPPLVVHYEFPLPSESPEVALHTTLFNIQKLYMVLTFCLSEWYGSQSKQPIFHCTALTGWIF